VFWLLFHFLLFWLILGASKQSLVIVLVVGLVSLLFACSPLAEGLWRRVSGVRPLMMQNEKDRLLPLFEEVYEEAMKADPNLPKGINLYIEEDMQINASAFGRSTLVLTRGSIALLSDDSLKGLIAHEFGHFSHYDTTVLLFATVGNFFMSLLMKLIRAAAKGLYYIVGTKDSAWIFKILYHFIMLIYKAVLLAGDLILMPVSRKHEFMADAFAGRCGFGNELAGVLSQIYQVSISKPGTLMEQLRSTHPPLPQRIQRLEWLVEGD